MVGDIKNVSNRGVATTTLEDALTDTTKKEWSAGDRKGIKHCSGSWFKYQCNGCDPHNNTGFRATIGSMLLVAVTMTGGHATRCELL